MKKLMILGFVLSLALGATSLSASTVRGNATGGRRAHVPPTAKPGPVAVPHKKGNAR